MACLSYISCWKNLTALIPGTTVEILETDSKNIIQLIVTAYNVSLQHQPVQNVRVTTVSVFLYLQEGGICLDLGLRPLGRQM